MMVGMAGTKNQRWVRHLTLLMNAAPHIEFGPQLNLEHILTRAQNALNSGKSLQRKATPNAERHVSITDIVLSQDKRFAAILFRLADKNGIDAVYEDLSSGAINRHVKKKTEANRSVCHLVIDLKGKAVGSTQRFRAILENVPGIARSTVASRLTSAGKKVAKSTGSLDGGKTIVNFTPDFQLQPYASKTIRQELAEGVLNAFTLTKELDVPGGFDEPPVIRAEKQKLELKVVADPASWIEKIFSAVRQVAVDQDYDVVRAHYQTSEGRTASTPVNIKKQDALEEMVSKIELVTLDFDMHPDHTNVHSDFFEKLTTLFD